MQTRRYSVSDKIIASHILLMYDGSMRSTATRSKEEALSEIETLKKQIEDGGDFADLAKQHSDCTSASSGGALGEFGRGQMVPEFEEAAFALDAGATSPVVETDFGYHLICRVG